MIDPQTTLGPPLDARLKDAAGVARSVVEDDHHRLIDRFAKFLHDLDDPLGVDGSFVNVGLGSRVLMLKANCLNRRPVIAGDRNVRPRAGRKPAVRHHAGKRKSRLVEVHHVQTGFTEQLGEFVLGHAKGFLDPFLPQAAAESLPTQVESPERMATDRFSGACTKTRENRGRPSRILPQQVFQDLFFLLVEFPGTAGLIFVQQRVRAAFRKAFDPSANAFWTDAKDVDNLIDLVLRVAEDDRVRPHPRVVVGVLFPKLNQAIALFLVWDFSENGCWLRHGLSPVGCGRRPSCRAPELQAICSQENEWIPSL